MGQGILISRTQLLLLTFIVFLCTSCEPSYPLIRYQLRDENGGWFAPLPKNINTYIELFNNGCVFDIHFSQPGNNFFSQLTIVLYTLEENKHFKIHDIVFEFENKIEIIKINKKINIKKRQTPEILIVEENNELKTKAFLCVSEYNHNRIKVYLQNIFNKEKEDIGKKIDLNLKINYSLDRGPVKTKELKYIVDINEGRPLPPDWMYLLFPGM